MPDQPTVAPPPPAPTAAPDPGSDAALLSPFSQTIGRFLNLPVTSWEHFFSPQIVFAYNPQDVGIEGHVLGRVGSYGHQLGQLIAMIGMLRDQLVPEEMPAVDGAVVTAFDRLREESRAAIDQYRAQPPTLPPAPPPSAPGSAALTSAGPLALLAQIQLGWLRSWTALLEPIAGVKPSA